MEDTATRTAREACSRSTPAIRPPWTEVLSASGASETTSSLCPAHVCLEHDLHRTTKRATTLRRVRAWCVKN
eukprot:746968-Hanusia_phi.AAC.2